MRKRLKNHLCKGGNFSFQCSCGWRKRSFIGASIRLVTNKVNEHRTKEKRVDHRLCIFPSSLFTLGSGFGFRERELRAFWKSDNARKVRKFLGNLNFRSFRKYPLKCTKSAACADLFALTCIQEFIFKGKL